MSTARILIVGIDYEDTPYPLSGALQDAAAIRDVVDAPDVRVLMAGTATAAAITESFAWLSQGALPGDIGVFYFSGHGVIVNEPQTSEPTSAILSADLECVTAQTIRSSLVLPSICAGVHLLVLLDCCHSGSMCGLATTFQVPHAVVSYMRHITGTAVSIAASTTAQRAGDGARVLHYDTLTDAWVSTAPHGTFTSALLDILAQGGLHTDLGIHAALCDRLSAEGVRAQTPVISGSSVPALNRRFPLQLCMTGAHQRG